MKARSNLDQLTLNIIWLWSIGTVSDESLINYLNRFKSKIYEDLREL